MWKRLSVVWMAVKGDALKLWYALGHPESPAWLKAGAAAMVLYLVSPIDLIPDFLPVVGVLDDLILVPLALRWLLARLPAHIRQYAQERSEVGSAAQRSARPADEVRGGKSRLR